MAQVQISDVVVPAEFTAYQVENSLVSTALFQSGVMLPNGEMAAQLQAGAQQFTVPFWSDIPDIEADITTDNSAVLSTPQKITAASQLVRKSFLHSSWSEMSLASELSGSEALIHVRSPLIQACFDFINDLTQFPALLATAISHITLLCLVWRKVCQPTRFSMPTSRAIG